MLEFDRKQQNSVKQLSSIKNKLKKRKRQPIEWEKIFANNVTDKGLVFKIFKQLMQLNIKRQKTNNKMGERS